MHTEKWIDVQSYDAEEVLQKKEVKIIISTVLSVYLKWEKFKHK